MIYDEDDNADSICVGNSTDCDPAIYSPVGDPSVTMNLPAGFYVDLIQIAASGAASIDDNVGNPGESVFISGFRVLSAYPHFNDDPNYPLPDDYYAPVLSALGLMTNGTFTVTRIPNSSAVANDSFEDAPLAYDSVANGRVRFRAVIKP